MSLQTPAVNASCEDACDFTHRGVTESLIRRRFSLIATQPTFYFSIDRAQSDPVFLTNLSSRKYRLLSPLKLSIDESPSRVLVSNRETGAYGVGRTREAAVKDFRSVLIEMYEELSDPEHQLSDALSEKLSRLQTLISLK